MSRRTMRAGWSSLVLVACTAPLVGCPGSLSPLRHFAEVGTDEYAVFAAQGPNGGGDLFAVRGNGGEVRALTFTPVDESAPALAPDGSVVAFLRGDGDGTPRTLWALNLVSGGERELTLPDSAGAVEQVAWASDAATLVVRMEGGLFRLPAPPRSGAPVRVPESGRVAAEASLAVLLGERGFARVVPCADREQALCVITRDGATSLLVEDGRDPARWGTDSVGYFVGERFFVRPLGAGRARELAWTPAPTAPQAVNFFPGRPAR